MCISPIVIKNPNAGAKKIGLNLLKDCTSATIKVPCGHCSECIAVRQMELIQRVLMEGTFCHLFFGTFTYNDSALPSVNINGYNIRYASADDFVNMIKRVRKVSLYPFRYFVVSERGSKHGRPHFHLLLSTPKGDVDPLNLERYFSDLFFGEWRRNYGSTRKPVYMPLCTLSRRYYDGRLSTNFDFHFVDPRFSDGGVADVGFYVIKYLMKADKHTNRLQQALKLNLHPSIYASIWDMVKSKTFFSKGYGLLDFVGRKSTNAIDKSDINEGVRKHIRKGIKYGLGKFPYPVFIHPISGATFPLSAYYKHYFFTDGDASLYWLENVEGSPYLDNIHDSEIKSLNQILSVIERYRRNCDLVEDKSFL